MMTTLSSIFLASNLLLVTDLSLAAPIETLKPGIAYYVPNSAHTVLGTVILFTVQWPSHGTQRVMAGCSEYDYGLPDLSSEMYTAEPDSLMFDLITQACGDIQWI